MLHLVDGIIATGEYAFEGGMKINDNVVVGPWSDSDRESSVTAEASQSIAFGGISSQETLPIDKDIDDVRSISSSSGPSELWN
jgi:hypothetical protein